MKRADRVRLTDASKLEGVPVGILGTITDLNEAENIYRVRWDRQPWDMPEQGIWMMAMELELADDG